MWKPCKACNGTGNDGKCLSCFTGEHISKEEWQQYAKDQEEVRRRMFPQVDPPEGYQEPDCDCCHRPWWKCAWIHDE